MSKMKDPVAAILDEDHIQKGMLDLVDLENPINNDDWSLSSTTEDIPNSQKAISSIKKDVYGVNKRDVVKSAMKLMSCGYMGKNLVAALKDRFPTHVLKNAKRELNALSRHEGLLGTIYLHGYVGDCNELKRIKNASFHTTTLRYAVKHKCAHEIDGNCPISGLKLIQSQKDVDMNFVKNIVSAAMKLYGVSNRTREAVLKDGSLSTVRSMFLALNKSVAKKEEGNMFDAIDREENVMDVIPSGELAQIDTLNIGPSNVPDHSIPDLSGIEQDSDITVGLDISSDLKDEVPGVGVELVKADTDMGEMNTDSDIEIDLSNKGEI